MKKDLHPYLVHTAGLTPCDRDKVLECLKKIAWIGPDIVAKTMGPSPDYIVYCHCSAEEFAALPFPVGFQWLDLTGYDLSSL